MTPLELEARIDQLSEQYADYLTDAQLKRFWQLHSKSPDAALIYLEQQAAAIAAKHQKHRINYTQRAEQGRLAQLAPWELCPDCGTPTPRLTSKAGRCRRCRAQRRDQANRQRRPLQRQCPVCHKWFDGTPPKQHQNRYGYPCKVKEVCDVG